MRFLRRIAFLMQIYPISIHPDGSAYIRMPGDKWLPV